MRTKESPLFWPAYFKGKALYVLNETLIPKKLVYTKVENARDAVAVIREMKTRAFGQLLVVLNAFLLELNNGRKVTQQQLLARVQETAGALNKSRPTFPFAEVTGMVVGWAHSAFAEGIDIRVAVKRNIDGYLQGIRGRRLQRVEKIASVIENGDSILTHCNVSGELAMAAAICLGQKKDVHFFATETRPYMQGAKLTTWELKRVGAAVTLVADNAVASLMADGVVNKVVVGSDRSAANGDFANKIGTYQIAVLAKEFGIPFYVLTQPSNRVPSGEAIPIEVRPAEEILKYEGTKIVRGNVDGFYPGFDVIPHEFVTQAIPIDVR